VWACRETLYTSALAALFGALVLAAFTGSAWAQADPCAAPANEIVAENCRPGDPASEWEVNGSGDPSIQGFATDISVDQGQALQFKVDTTASAYRADIYRMGWYGGDGARLVATVSSSAQSQPECLSDGANGLIDCGNWSASASWNVPGTAVSGIYFARLVREDGTAGASHVPFIVRDDDGRSDFLFQTSDTTWQAYNRYGGNSLYTGSPAGRAYKVSYNRPFTTREYAAEDWVFNAEYPMVRWLERNGYDVSYFTDVDSDRLGAELREHRAFLSVGHDEYWSGAQRANVEAARDAGVNLAFFSGNEVFWKTRWENGHRTLVSYKETHANAKIDPTPVWTGTWRDPRFSPPADGGRPENALTGTIFSVNSGTRALQVPAAEGRLRLWRNAGLPPAVTATLAADTVGYEWDEDLDNGARPPGLVRLSATTASGVEKLLDYGSTYGPGTATHRLTLYRDANGAGPDALVFGAGTVQWSWGLDGDHDRGGSTPSVAMQQATVNLFADMLVQPAALQAGLTPAGASTDTTPPTSAPNTPTRIVTAGTPVTVSGTAADSGGGRVGGVEVSVDGGLTWHPATGLESWSYTWTPIVGGQVTVRSRAVDDSGNLEGRDGGGSPGGGVPPGTPPAGGTPPTATGPGTPAADQVAPQVRVRPRRVRASRRGLVKLRVSCPSGEGICRVDLRLRRAGTTVARKELEVTGGRTRVVSLRLTQSARRRLLRSGSLSVVALAAARDLAANRGTTSTRIRVLAPKEDVR
jgi:Bacterial Ig domain